MLKQTILLFKLGTTEDALTAHGGLALFGEFCAAMKLKGISIVIFLLRAAVKGFTPEFMFNRWC